jgi:hypothetical protein
MRCGLTASASLAMACGAPSSTVAPQPSFITHVAEVLGIPDEAATCGAPVFARFTNMAGPEPLRFCHDSTAALLRTTRVVDAAGRTVTFTKYGPSIRLNRAGMRAFDSVAAVLSHHLGQAWHCADYRLLWREGDQLIRLDLWDPYDALTPVQATWMQIRIWGGRYHGRPICR